MGPGVLQGVDNPLDLVHKRRVTIKDVARLAGVSVATVSYALAGRDKCSEETKQRVVRAVRELNYVPQAAARQLKRQRTQTVGILVPLLEGPGRLEDNPFYWEFVSAAETEGRNSGYRVLIAQTAPDDSLEFVVERNLDGLVILGAYPDYPVLAKARELNIPAVLVDSYLEGDWLQVRIDDYQGGYLATRHLIALGHRDVGMITGTRRRRGVHYERYLGFRAALVEAGLTERTEWVLEGPVSSEGGSRMARRLLSAADRPAAVFASADNLAYGVLTAARELQVAVPEQLSVIGFDDLPLSRHVVPTLSTIRQDIHGKGVEAIRLIVRSYELGRVDPVVNQVGVELVTRDSTAPAHPAG